MFTSTALSAGPCTRVHSEIGNVAGQQGCARSQGLLHAQSLSRSSMFGMGMPQFSNTTEASFGRQSGNHFQSRAAIARAPVNLEEESSSNALVASLGPDMFILELAESLQEQEKPGSLGSRMQILESLAEAAASTALNLKWPTQREEQYRFTDLKPLRSSDIAPASPVSAALPNGDVGEGIQLESFDVSLKEADGSRLVFVDGVFSPRLSSMDSISDEVVVGTLGTIPEDAVQQYVTPNLRALTDSTAGSLDLFAALNAIGALDLGVVIVPPGVVLEKPVHVVYVSTGSGKASVARASNPRLLVVVGEGAAAQLVEEFVGPTAGYWTNAAADILLARRARLAHGYVQAQHRDAFHIKRTFVAQAELSEYSVVEAGLGSRLSRHNLRIEQRGPDTQAAVSSFFLAGERQVHDLHSALLLEHPRGQTRQLHKCIVTQPTGQAVFDGNVRVNRYAQQTDAGQLSRSLLLAPRGTVNVKPNLQIIADDVKCTHGAAISDLEDEQLFYFRARGIDEHAARSALVFSFAAEVIERLPYPELRRRLEESVKRTLLAEGAMDSSVAAGLVGSQS